MRIAGGAWIVAAIVGCATGSWWPDRYVCQES